MAFSTAAAPQTRNFNHKTKEKKRKWKWNIPLMAMEPSFVAVREERVPANEPTGVLATATM